MKTGYYVTMRRGSRVAWLLGPCPTHDEALRLVDLGARLAESLDTRSSFDRFGTAYLASHRDLRLGVLNRFLPAAPPAKKVRGQRRRLRVESYRHGAVT